MKGPRAALVSFLVLFPLGVQAGWQFISYIPDWPDYQGSAMCYSQTGGAGEVWLLHGDPPGEHGHFHCYSVADGWHEEARMPQDPSTDWGGALTFVHDPYSFPADGWVFALKGNRTQQFWVYLGNTWVRGPDIPWPVWAGGALCFGGYHEWQGTSVAFVYAFTGSDDLASCRFYRYVFDVVPHDGPASGVWEQLSTFPWEVQEGGAITWCPMTDDVQYPKGLVIAMRGDDSQGIYAYNPVANNWEHLANANYTIGQGGAITTGPALNQVFCFRGNNANHWWYFDVTYRQFSYFTGSNLTPQDQKKGSALCYDGRQYVYAEFGAPHDYYNFYKFSLDDPQGQGGQGLTSADGETPVKVLSGPGLHRFVVRSSKPVHLDICDALGGMVHSTSVQSSSGQAELVWNHSGAGAGVYFYRLCLDRREFTGKLAIVR